MAEKNYLAEAQAKLQEIWEQDSFDALLSFVKKSLLQSYLNGISRGKREAAGKDARNTGTSKE